MSFIESYKPVLFTTELFCHWSVAIVSLRFEKSTICYVFILIRQFEYNKTQIHYKKVSWNKQGWW